MGRTIPSFRTVLEMEKKEWDSIIPRHREFNNTLTLSILSSASRTNIGGAIQDRGHNHIYDMDLLQMDPLPELVHIVLLIPVLDHNNQYPLPPFANTSGNHHLVAERRIWAL